MKTSRLRIPSDYGRARGLRRQSEAPASALMRIAGSPARRPVRLRRKAARAWAAMSAAASADGITLLPLSGFRSIARQTALIRRKLAAGIPLSEALRVLAAPGYSEHHTGRALDIGAPGDPPMEETFEHTAAFGWLKEHAARFGFHLSYPRGNRHGITYEPWHWYFEVE